MHVEYRVLLLWFMYIFLDDVLKNDLNLITRREKRITENSFYREFLRKMYEVLLLERCLFPSLYKILI